jgi:choline dehydrogenase-like flavoprotein
MGSAMVGVCAALLPPEHGGPDPVALARDVDDYLARLPRPTRGAARAGAAGVDLAARALSGGRSLASLPAPRREDVLERLARSRRTADGVDLLKAMVLLVAGLRGSSDWLVERAGVGAPVMADPPMDVTPATDWPSASSWDAVVVGSGAGGAMTARTLAREGMRVVVVEEGRRFGVEDFRTGAPADRLASLYRGAGSTMAFGHPSILVPVGRGVGGTTLVNSGTCYRPPDAVLERWRDAGGVGLADPSSLGRYLDEVETTLRVAPAAAASLGRNALIALEGARRLGWKAAPLLRNAAGCDGCCQCALGCPHNAKLGMHLTALPQACEAGARIVSEARVLAVARDRGRARGVVAVRRDGSRFVLHAPTVVVAAGATETPLLLRRSGLGRHPGIGRNMALHPAIAIAGRFDEAVESWNGVLQSVGVEEFHERDGILIEATAAPKGMGFVGLPGHGADLVRSIEDSGHLATIGALVSDLGVGKVHGRSRALLRYDLTDRDAARLRKAVDVMGRLLFAAGATEVHTGLRERPRVPTVEALAEAASRADLRRVHLAAFHPTGTARMGGDPQRAPVDPHGRLRGSRGVWVTDASILPSSPTVNPQVTIMALSLAVADGVVEAVR